MIDRAIVEAVDTMAQAGREIDSLREQRDKLAKALQNLLRHQHIDRLRECCYLAADEAERVLREVGE